MPPRVALAMVPELFPSAFTAAQLARLEAVAVLANREPLASFADERAPELLAGCDVLLGHWGCPPLDAAALDLAPDLRLFAYAAGTVKAIVTPAVWERGVVVTSAAAVNAVPVAEFALAAILFANKGVFASREWFRDRSVRVKRPQPVGNVAKQVGIIGASHVGRPLLELLRPFDLTVVVADPYVRQSDLDVPLVELDELLATSDVVSLHAPDLPSTRGMLGAAQLARMKDGATFVNTARGALVDTAALEVELATGRISAVLDVTDPEPLPPSSPLWSLPNVYLTPHVAGAQGSELSRLADLAIEEVERYAAGLPPRFEVRAADWDRIA